MSDLRPSENGATPTYPKFPEMQRRGFFDDVPTGDEFFADNPEMQAGLGFETADAQHILAAIDRLTEQQRIANLIAFEQISGEKNRGLIRAGLGL